MNKRTKLACIFLILTILGCKKDKSQQIREQSAETQKQVHSPDITFSPASGINYSAVSISGNFSTTPGDNVVKFNGVTGIINSSSATQIVATVPAIATTGKIAVIVNGITTTSATDFKVLKMVKENYTITGSNKLFRVSYVCFDGVGNTYAYASPDTQPYIIKIKPDGSYSSVYKINTSAGGNKSYGYGKFAVDRSGNIYVIRSRSYYTMQTAPPRPRLNDVTCCGWITDELVMLKIKPNGTSSVVAGNIPGYVDGPVASARFNYVQDIAIVNNNLYFIDEIELNRKLRKITPGGSVSTLGTIPFYSINAGNDNQFYFLEYGQMAKMNASGVKTIIAGKANQYGITDGRPDQALFEVNAEAYTNIALDAAGNIFSVHHTQNLYQPYAIRITNTAGYTSTIPSTINNLNKDMHMVIDKFSGNLIITDKTTITSFTFK
ncbi:MAG: hypothetical protein EOP47_13465 [Sphingobacteriaceae bacterium]|nr:MAG: hypothetical protein EOP47_13465 [Sphingobacteriaceae bacterium]